MPEKPADVHPTVHYTQLGYNELGFTAAENIYKLLNEQE